MRKLTNCLVAGQLGAILAAELVFILNPEVSHTWTHVLSVFAVFSFTYGLGLALGFFLLLQLFEMVRGAPLGPAWLSFRVLTWLFMICLLVAAILSWHNLERLNLFLPDETRHTMALAATVVTTAAAAFLVMGLFHVSFGRRGAYASHALSALSLVAAVSLPLIARPQPVEPPSIPRLPLQDTPSLRRITILGLEGASMSFVLPAVAEGKLPNFARLIESGASGALRTIRPTESLAVWTSVATGKLPRKHGLKAFYRYRFPRVETPFTLRPRGLDFRSLVRIGAIQRSPVTSTQRRTQPFWSILSRFGVRVGLLRWWGSYPADEVEGFIVSEYFHRQVRERFAPPLPKLTHPESLFERLAPHVISPESIPEETLSRFVDTSVTVPEGGVPWRPMLSRAIADDTTYHAIGESLRAELEPDVFAIYFFGLDSVGHFFTRYQRPELFGDVSDAEKRKFGRTVEAYYRFLDALLGEYLKQRADNEILVVVSGHGMEPLSILMRATEPFKGNPYLSGYHEAAPDGLLILQGPGVARGAKLTGASILDVTPTLLYLLRLPLARDMDGRLRTDALSEELLRTQPVTFISSYHDFLIEHRRDDEPLDETSRSMLDGLPELEEPPD